jgi:predicted amidohydrolase YtcJ
VGGQIVRDTVTGEPTGLFLDDAIYLVIDQAFALPLSESMEAMAQAIAVLNRAGVTSFVEGQATNESYDQIYRGLESNGNLKARVNVALWVDPNQEQSQIEGLISRFSHDVSARVRINQAKLFVDGVMEQQTAVLLEPYVNSNNSGTPSFSQEQLNWYTTQLEAAGFQIRPVRAGQSSTCRTK